MITICDKRCGECLPVFPSLFQDDLFPLDVSRSNCAHGAIDSSFPDSSDPSHWVLDRRNCCDPTCHEVEQLCASC
uniref:Uncharacterized protein n=1 Tax=Trichuris muris TaxID=70415 RepID=A0A5S6QA14_TRIMR